MSNKQTKIEDPEYWKFIFTVSLLSSTTPTPTRFLCSNQIKKLQQKVKNRVKITATKIKLKHEQSSY